MFGSLFSKSRVLVTGHTGFKGSWLSTWLLQLGAEVHGFSLPEDQSALLFKALDLREKFASDTRADIADHHAVAKAIADTRPQFIFHLAAQPIVRRSFNEPLETFQTNLMGTINVLEAIRSHSTPTVCIVVSSDKCYENREWLHAYREEDAMGGFDPYSASKGCVEIATAAYRRSFFSAPSPHRVATARAGNVIGGGDWAVDRIVPDVFRALKQKQPVPIRNKHSTRPWQHVLEPLSGYLWLAANLAAPQIMNLPTGELAGSFNFGPPPNSNRTVVDVVETIFKHAPGTWVDAASSNAVHEAGKLNVAIDKAFHLLGWSPTWDFETAIAKTAVWYVAGEQSPNLYSMTTQQIAEYEQQARMQSNPWAIR